MGTFAPAASRMESGKILCGRESTSRTHRFGKVTRSRSGGPGTSADKSGHHLEVTKSNSKVFKGHENKTDKGFE